MQITQKNCEVDTQLRNNLHVYFNRGRVSSNKVNLPRLFKKKEWFSFVVYIKEQLIKNCNVKLNGILVCVHVQ